MFTQTLFEEFKLAVDSALANDKKVVVVVREILGDFITPVTAYHTLRHPNGSALLDSVSFDRQQGLYSILGTDPYVQFQATGTTVFFKPLGSSLCGLRLDNQPAASEMPLVELERLLKCYSPEEKHQFFTGGAIGYLGHEAIGLLEPSVHRHSVNDLNLPDILFQFYRHLLVFDHATQSLYLICVVGAEDGNLKTSYDEAIGRLEQLEKRLRNSQLLRQVVPARSIKSSSNLKDGELEEKIIKAGERIAAGDIFQVVLSRRFETSFPASSSLDFFRLLRRVNPSPYLFHIDFGNDVVLVGASPEVMVRVKDREMLVRPLAGTRKRGAGRAEDEIIGRDLAGDPKERAEHIMLVDLVRNDVGRFCQAGSVRVYGLMRVEPYGAVLHMVTDVCGQLKEYFSSLTAALGSLPAGTLSGAPKIRALQIIAELEPCGRGPYGGAVGWLTDRDLDLCIMIRNAVLVNGRLYWQAGAGIVADSVPVKERDEIFAKSESIRKVLRMMAGSKENE